jgi:hypothetical protein
MAVNTVTRDLRPSSSRIVGKPEVVRFIRHASRWRRICRCFRAAGIFLALVKPGFLISLRHQHQIIEVIFRGVLLEIVDVGLKFLHFLGRSCGSHPLGALQVASEQGVPYRRAKLAALDELVE